MLQDQNSYYLFYYPVALAFISASAATLFFPSLRRSNIWLLSLLGFAFFVLFNVIVMIVGFDEGVRTDHAFFWRAGKAALSGANPYQDPGFVNPPTAVPVYMILALMNDRASFVLLTALNAAASASLVYLSYLVVSSGEANDMNSAPKLEPKVLALLSVAFALSVPVQLTLRLGQVSVLVTLSLLIALYAKQRNWPFLSGLGFALATIKVGTMIPFALPLLRMKYRLVWQSLVLSSFALALFAPGFQQIFDWLATNLSNIVALSKLGAANDYSLSGAHYHTIVGLEPLFYHMSRSSDRGLLFILQLVSLGLLGLSILLEVTLFRRWPKGLLLSIVALYSAIFLYHRTHDLVILVVPLVYIFMQLQIVSQSSRRYLMLAFIFVCTILFSHPRMNVGVAAYIERLTFVPDFIGSFLSAVLVALPTLLIALTIVLLALSAPRRTDDVVPAT